MEIKKGISQMAEYPNAEINYVVPADGKMYYVLKNGELKNGCVIATLDPKKAIDDGVYCDNIGVFNADGSVLIDFNKKEIKNINDEFVLAVNAIPTSDDVVNALKNESDEISKAMLKNSSTTIVDKMMIEMGITGELLFSDSYSEANIYKLDMPNHKVGLDSSFIGMNDSNFYFHSNDVSDETSIVDLNGNVNEPNKEEKGFSIPEYTNDINESVVSEDDSSKNLESNIEVETKNVDIENSSVSNPGEESVQNAENSIVPEVNLNVDDDFNDNGLKLDISQNILGGFKAPSEVHESNESSIVLEEKVEVPEETNIDMKKESFSKSDEILDSVIEVMKKMIEETNKLNEKIIELENQIKDKNMEIENNQRELAEKNSIIAAQESKKDELSNLLDEANEVLDNIE